MTDRGLTYISIFCALFGCVPMGCRHRGTQQNEPEIAVTNSYLQCVVRDLYGEDVDVLCLAPPGMCPGHFDISPAQVKQLCRCRILLLFDFQKSGEASLSRIKANGLKTALVKTPPGLCVPEAYVATCREVCNILSSEYHELALRYKERLQLVEKRLESLNGEFHTEIEQSGLGSAKVIASNRQAQFCNWLGLETIATFLGSDAETVSNIDHCLRKAQEQGVKFVVANKQQGTGLAKALAQRLGVKMVVFSNFPALDGERNPFDRLVRQNVKALLEAAEQ